MYKSTGIIRARPQSKSTPLRPWWSIVHCCTGLTEYYLATARRAYWFHKGIQRPAWGGHISIIRGEEPLGGQSAWRKIESLEETTIDFTYTGEIETDGKHFWLSVSCESAETIRESLNLPRQPKYPFHLTFGVIEGTR